MLKIENVEIAGWEAAIRGMRNPKNSWERSDSERKFDSYHDMSGGHMEIGPNDKTLMLNLAKGGPVHAKYRRMIVVWLDITAPLYWWKEFDTYKVGTVANSCSTMHKVMDKEFVADDFSFEDICPNGWTKAMTFNTPGGECDPATAMTVLLGILNGIRDKYIELDKVIKNASDSDAYHKAMAQQKVYWRSLIQLLPSSYNQKRTICLNYEVLHHIYHDRRFHKLDEWHVVCDWIESLPYSEIMTQKVVGIE